MEGSRIGHCTPILRIPYQVTPYFQIHVSVFVSKAKVVTGWCCFLWIPAVFLHLCYNKKQILKRGNVRAATDKQSSGALNLSFYFLTGTPVNFQIRSQMLASIAKASTCTPSPPPETCEYSRDALNDMLSLLGSS